MPLSATMKALSDPNRRKVLEVLKEGDMPVGEILQHLEITGASLSHHLNTLKQADLVSSRPADYIFIESFGVRGSHQ